MPDHPAEPISDRLRRLREAAGLSQYALAQRASLSRAVLHRIEAGQRKPSWPVLLRLATALSLDLGDLSGCTSD